MQVLRLWSIGDALQLELDVRRHGGMQGAKAVLIAPGLPRQTLSGADSISIVF
jgi:hypothetical protein